VIQQKPAKYVIYYYWRMHKTALAYHLVWM